MTLNRYFLISCLALSAFGCSDSKESPLDPPVSPDKPAATTQIVTFTTDVLTRSVVTELGESAEMNVYAKEYKTLGAQDVVEGSIKSVCKSKVWTSSPEIKLKKDEKAFLYALYPYASANTDPTAVAVDANKQIDYLYSGEGIMASYTSPKVSLTMSHALAVMAFNVCKSSYSGAGVLQEIKVQGDKFVTTGTLNVEKGTIASAKVGKLTVRCDKKLEEGGWTNNLPQTFTLPNVSDGQNIALTLVVDGRDYVVLLPNVTIEQGYKYIFRLGLTDRGITLFADATEKISLKQETDKMPIESGVSTLVFNYLGKSITLPQITGKSMAPGIVNWGDTTPGNVYYVGLSHNYPDVAEHQISVENWNAEEITFSSLKGIQSIDITAF